MLAVRFARFSRFLAGLFAVLAAPAAWSACVTVNTAAMGGWVQYGDAQSYSTPVANYFANGGNVSNQGPFKISGSDANDCMFVAIDQNGSFPGFTGAEVPYATPTGINGTTYFATAPATDRTGTVSTIKTQVSNAWDASLGTLKTFLTQGGTTFSPVFLFMNNQQNSASACGGAADSFCQSLAAWARVWVTDANGKDLGYNFLLTNHASPYALFTDTVPGGGVPNGNVAAFSSGATDPMSGGTASQTDFVLSGGDVCIASDSNGVLPTVPVSCVNGKPPGYDTLSAPIKHNLGNNEYPYVIQFPELNAVLGGLFGSLTDLVLADYTLHVDVRLGCGNPLDSQSGAAIFPSQGDACLTSGTWGNGLNNGGEQVVIALGMPFTRDVPEPGVLLLVAAGLAGMAGAARLRRRARQA